MYERPYEKLLVWQQAHALCIEIYRLTRKFPKEEQRRLVDQMSRASASVPTNIVEGNGRHSNGDKRRFLNIASASLEELHYQCTLARDLQYCSSEECIQLQSKIRSVSYLLNKLRSAFA